MQGHLCAETHERYVSAWFDESNPAQRVLAWFTVTGRQTGERRARPLGNYTPLLSLRSQVESDNPEDTGMILMFAHRRE